MQCVLCVTEGLEGVYLLAIDDLGEQDEANPHSTEAVLSLDDGAVSSLHASATGGNSGLESAAGGHGHGHVSGGGKRGKSGSAKRSAAAAATARHAPKRAVADTAFPSLVHLASRGEQRKRAGSAQARHPLAEPVFIASLARRGAGGGGESKGQPEQQESGDDRGSRRHSTGSGGRGPRKRGGGSRAAAAPFECLWWVTRDGDHFAIIGGPSGEVKGQQRACQKAKSICLVYLRSCVPHRCGGTWKAFCIFVGFVSEPGAWSVGTERQN